MFDDNTQKLIIEADLSLSHDSYENDWVYDEWNTGGFKLLDSKRNTYLNLNY